LSLCSGIVWSKGGLRGRENYHSHSLNHLPKGKEKKKGSLPSKRIGESQGKKGNGAYLITQEDKCGTKKKGQEILIRPKENEKGKKKLAQSLTGGHGSTTQVGEKRKNWRPLLLRKKKRKKKKKEPIRREVYISTNEQTSYTDDKKKRKEEEEFNFSCRGEGDGTF